VEALVSVMLVSVALLGVSTMFLYALSSVRHAQYKIAAIGEAQAIVERMRAGGFDSLTHESFPTATLVSGLATQSQLPHGVASVRFLPYPEEDSVGQKLCLVTVTWGTGGPASGRTSLSTVISGRTSE
jgi:hypothetical protein